MRWDTETRSESTLPPASRRRMASLVGLVACVASCAAAAVSMVVKPPLQSQCQRFPINGCGELVDGVLLYVEGDKPGALAKINKAKGENTPEQLKPFAKALRDTASLPGAEDYAAPMNQIADLLDAATVTATVAISSAPSAQGAATAASEGAPPPAGQHTSPVTTVRQDPATRAVSATADFARLVTETVDLSIKENRTPCKIAGLEAFCVKAREGVLILTDVIAGRSCPDRVFVGATLSDSPDFGFRWQLEPGTSSITGARLAVGATQWLQVAIVSGKKGPSNSTECFVTWSGFRPWIVPGSAY
jgi:hypothetical protein